jgi:hypothetical protein
LETRREIEVEAEVEAKVEVGGRRLEGKTKRS